MKFKLFVLLLALCAIGGGGYAFRTWRHNAEPAVKAQRLADEGKLREALVEYRNASRDNPKDAGLHVRTGQVQSKLADPVAAEREFRIALQLGADRAEVAPLLGESVLVQGRFRDVLREIQPRAPDPATLAKVLQLRALAQLGLDDLPAAQATLKDAEARVPGTMEVSLIGARVAAAENNPALMQSRVDEVLRLDPNQVEALLMDEKLRVMQGDRPAAMALADRAVKAAPWSAMARIERASQFLTLNKDKEAQADVDAVLQAQPRFIDAVYLNGILMARRGQLVEAAAQLEKLDTVAGRLPQGLYFQSLIAMQQGNQQTAADFARRYNTLVPLDPEGMRQLGRTELALNRPAAALPVLLKLSPLAPKDAEVFDMLGRCYASLSQPAEAEKAFRTALELAPNEALYRYHYGAQQLQAGQFGTALPLLEAAFAAEPKMPGGGESLVNAALALGDVPKAEAVLAKLRAVAGDTEEVAQLSAATKMRQGDLPGARAILAEAARKYPNAPEIRVTLAQVLSQQGQVSEAMGLLTTILAKEPARFSALNGFIRLKTEDNDLPAAVKALEAAHKAAPKDAAITSMLADGLTASGDARRAVDVLTETSADTALAPVLAGALGRAQLAMQRPEEAKATYRRVLAERPDDLLARGSLAALLNNEKDFAGVRATLTEALARSPGNYSLMSGLVANEVRWKGPVAGAALADELRGQPGAMPLAAALKGDMFLAVNQPADAATAYLAEYRLTPSLPMLGKTTGAMVANRQLDQAAALISAWLKDHPNDPVAAQRLAQVQIQQERYPEAQKSLDIVLAAQPNNAVALNNLAWSYVMTGDPRAVATAQKAYLGDPGALAGDTLGWALVKAGSAKAAVPLLQRAAGLRPGDRGIQYHLAAALMEDGRRPESWTVLQPLLDAPAFRDQDAARKLAETVRPN